MQHYLPKAESEFVKTKSQHYLRDLVRADMNGMHPDTHATIPKLTLSHYCEHCGVRLQTPGAHICFLCGKPQSTSVVS